LSMSANVCTASPGNWSTRTVGSPEAGVAAAVAAGLSTVDIRAQ
jgi:hypothetical protein